MHALTSALWQSLNNHSPIIYSTPASFEIDHSKLLCGNVSCVYAPSSGRGGGLECSKPSVCFYAGWNGCGAMLYVSLKASLLGFVWRLPPKLLGPICIREALPLHKIANCTRTLTTILPEYYRHVSTRTPVTCALIMITRLF